MLGALLILLAAYCAGAAVLGRCPRLAMDHWTRRLVFRTGLGLALLAFAMLAAGTVGLAKPISAWLLLAAAGAVGGPTLWAEWQTARRQAVTPSPVEFAREETVLHPLPGGVWPRALTPVVLAALAMTALFVAARALAPAAAYDDLTYHLAAPKVFARTGWVTVLPYDHHSAFPFSLEMLYTLALLISGDGAAKLVHTACWLLTLTALWSLARGVLGERCAWLTVLIAGTTPLALFPAGAGYNEHGFALYQVLAWLALVEYLNLRRVALTAAGDGVPEPLPRQAQWSWLCGVCAGLTYGTKYTAVLVVAFLFAALGVLGWRDGRPRRALRAEVLAFAVSATVVASPWIARTWLATGSPVFPFAHRVFASRHWSADRAAAYDGAQKEFGRAFTVRQGEAVNLEPTPTSHRSLARLLAVPWQVTFSPDWYYDRGYAFDGKHRIGPAWLAFALPALVGVGWLWSQRRRGPGPPAYEEQREEDRQVVHSPEFGREVAVAHTRRITARVALNPSRLLGLLLAHVAFMGLAWFYSMQYLRYAVPQLMLWSLLAAWGADLLLRLRWSALAATAVLLLQAAGGLAYALTAGFPALQVHLGGLEVERYAAAGLPAYTAMQWVNANTAPTAKVALYGEPRGYWLDRDYLWAERGHNTLVPDEARTSLDAYLAQLGRLGVTHALVYEPACPLDRVEGGDEVALLTQALRRGRLRLVFRDERRRTSVYELR